MSPRNESGEGVFQRRILRALKEQGWINASGARCLTQPELREIMYGTRRPGWTHNFTLERALRSLEARDRVRRYWAEHPDCPFYVRPSVVIQYLRPSGIPDPDSNSGMSDG